MVNDQWFSLMAFGCVLALARMCSLCVGARVLTCMCGVRALTRLHFSRVRRCRMLIVATIERVRSRRRVKKKKQIKDKRRRQRRIISHFNG